MSGLPLEDDRETRGAARKHDIETIRNYIEWRMAVNGGGGTVELHRRLVREDRPYPTGEEALAALGRIESDV